MSNKASDLRQLLKDKPFLKIIGAHNALGAKLAQIHKFDGVWSSGFEIATAHGVPDANILTMTENLDAAMNINSACQLPVICDCDTGYGNAINAMHMVRKYESAGLAALVIEDKRFPKVNSFIPGLQELASVDEFVGKIEAMRNARSSNYGILLFARIEALIAGWGIDEAFRRAVAYYEAGADGLVIHSKSKTPDEIFAFAKLWNQKLRDKCPLIAIPTTYYKVTANELASHGFKIAIYANQGMRASVRAMNEVFAQVQKDGTTAGIENKIVPMEELFSLQGMTTYQEDEKRYGNESEIISAVIPAAADHKFQPELSAILQDRPLCMLEIGGQTLLDHQINVLHSVGIRSIHVVVGYQKEKVSAKGIETIENAFFDSHRSAYSVLRGLSKAKGKTLITYSDIIFDRQIPEALLKSPYPITLIIDRAFRTLPRRDKSLDLVITSDVMEKENLESRRLQMTNYKKIVRIGKNVGGQTASHEFIGMILLSKEGLEMMRDAWEEAQKTYAHQPFYEAPSIAQASTTDLIQFMIGQNIEIHGLVIEHGWSEIYSLGDYERLNRYFCEKNKNLTLQT